MHCKTVFDFKFTVTEINAFKPVGPKASLAYGDNCSQLIKYPSECSTISSHEWHLLVAGRTYCFV